jgi:hypothetical protein
MLLVHSLFAVLKNTKGVDPYVPDFQSQCYINSAPERVWEYLWTLLNSTIVQIFGGSSKKWMVSPAV